MKYLTSIDMSQNEIQNAVLHNSSTAPANPKVGQMYADTSEEVAKLFWFNGLEWIELGPSAPEVAPKVTAPSVSIEISSLGSGAMEVGSVIPISYTARLNPGSYSYGPDTGIIPSSWRVYDGRNESSSASGTFEDVIVDDTTEYKITAEATYEAGAIPFSDQGKPYPSAQIPAGTKSASTSSISGYRKYFYGSSLDILDIGADAVRSMTHSDGPIGNGTSFELEVLEGTNQVIIAFPSSSGRKLSKVLDTGALNINIADCFEKSVIKVGGINNYSPVDYDVYVYSPDLSLTANMYMVTIS